MELTANRRPFVFIPLQHHFEQNFHVAHPLHRRGAGMRLDYRDAADPEVLAAAIASQIDAPIRYLPVDPNGAARAADRIAELLQQGAEIWGSGRLSGLAGFDWWLFRSR